MSSLNETWPLALNFSERLQRIDLDLLTAIDLEAGRKRAARWARLVTADSEESNIWERRVDSAGLTADQFAQVLGADPAAFTRNEELPEWVACISDLYKPVEVPDDLRTELSISLGTWNISELVELTLLPLFKGAANVFHHATRLGAALPGDPARLVARCWAATARQVEMMTLRVMVVELHAAMLEGDLAATTSSGRFEEFVARYRSPETCLELLANYPVLAREIFETITTWEKATMLFLDRVVQDWPVVCSTLGAPHRAARIVDLDRGAGDSHGGQSVTTITTESGWRVVYKPRSVVAESAVHNVLEQLSEWGAAHEQKTWRVLDCDSHGWVEAVEVKTCDEPAEVTRHYERLGALLAVLYVIGGTDIHRENVIAHGEFPVVIDLETLLAPEPARSEDEAQTRLLSRVEDSVLNTLLLPQRRGDMGIDDSGVGDGEETQTVSLPILVDVGSDRTRMERRDLAVPATDNVATLNGNPIRAVDYVSSLLVGFKEAYGLLADNRDKLADPDGLLGPLRQTELRAVLRDTRTYAYLLNEGDHPHLLGDALERDMHLDHLWTALDAAPFVESIIPHELRDLRNRDIPFFSCFSDSQSAWSSSGTEIPNVFARSGWERHERRLERLSDQDLEHQLFLIAASFIGAAGNAQLWDADFDPELLKVGRNRKPATIDAESADPVNSEELLCAATTIADQLQASELVAGSRSSWFGFDEDGDEAVVGLVGADLYSGLAGIAVFLAEHNRQSGTHREMAERASASLAYHIETYGRSLDAVGGYSGWGGLVWSAHRLTELGFDMSDQLDQWVQRAGDVVSDDTWADVTHGAAGLGLAALAAADDDRASKAMELAFRCADHLLGLAVPSETGAVWATAADVVSRASPALAGMAHGAAGIGLFFARFALTTGEQWAWDLALECFAYERSIFDPERGNWPDLRVFSDEDAALFDEGPRFAVAWCHGAAGIAHSRAAILVALDHSEFATLCTPEQHHAMRSELDAATKTTARLGFSGNHGLCHGHLGNLDIVRTAAAALGDDAAVRQAYVDVRRPMASLAEGRPSAGLPLGVVGPGLMTGLSGMGYGLLRLADPDGTADVLSLDQVRSRRWS